jgi:integrase
MSLLKRSGKWHFRFRFDGKRYAQATGLAANERSRKAAEQQEFNYRQALIEGRNPTLKLIVREFSDAAATFLGWAEHQYREYPSSCRRIKTSLSSATVFFGKMPVSMIDEAQIESYKLHRIAVHKVRDVTVRHDLYALSTFFKYAIRQRWTRENPVRNVAKPSDANAVRIHVVTEQEAREYFNLAAKMNPDVHDVGRIMLNQGMRPEEVTGLAKTAVDLERGTLRIVKGKTPASRRLLDLTSETKSILARRTAGSSPWFFPSKRSKGKHVLALDHGHNAILAKAEEEGVSLNFVMYDFRHTFATKMAQAGVDLATLAAILGHSNLRVVQKYVHPTAEHKKNAMAKYDAVMLAGQVVHRA